MNTRISIQHALIMAAGRGNRMRPLTDIFPKAMLPFKEDTLIGNSLKMLRDCVLHIHVTVGYKRAMLSQYLMETGVDSILNTEGHGNAWWIQNTLMKYLDEPVLVLTTDNVTELDIDFLNREYLEADSPPCMLVPVKPIPMIEGDYIYHHKGVVLEIQRNIPKDIYCSGIQVINPARVSALMEGINDFKDVWDNLILKHQLRVSSIYPKAWFSIDTLEQLVNFSKPENHFSLSGQETANLIEKSQS
jgi:MurNAc alpha-1-phosphate uridylyltransferase